jgi:rRNA maturation protein Nop10
MRTHALAAVVLSAACTTDGIATTMLTVVIDRDVDVAGDTGASADTSDSATDEDTDADTDSGTADTASEACGPPGAVYGGGEPLERLRGLEVTLCRYDTDAVRAYVHAYALDQDQVPVCGEVVEVAVYGTIFDPNGGDWWSVWTPGASVGGCAAGSLAGVWAVQGTAYVEGDDARYDRVERTTGLGWTRTVARRLEVVP